MVSEEGGVLAAWTCIPLLAQAAVAEGAVTLSVCEWLLFHLTARPVELLPHPQSII